MSLHAKKWSDISGFRLDISFKILYFLVTRLSEVLGNNVQAVSVLYTYSKMPGKCSVSDCSDSMCYYSNKAYTVRHYKHLYMVD